MVVAAVRRASVGLEEVDLTVPSLAEFARPSRQLHNGSRWFVTFREGDVPNFFPGGPSSGRLVELDIRSEGGTPVPLTDNAGACIQIWGSDPGARFEWAPDASGQMDGAISWIGTRWEDVDNNGSCDQVVDGGIFRGAISIDGSGNVSFSQPTAPEVAVALNGAQTEAAELAWAPDGQQVAFSSPGPQAGTGNALWVANTSGSRSSIFSGRIYDLSWSPDQDPASPGAQTRIAFTGRVLGANGSEQERGTYTIAPNGTGRTRIAAGRVQKSTGPWSHHTDVHWSPAGSQVLYTEMYVDTTTTRRLRRVNAGGTNDVVLVTLTGSTNNLRGLAWTAD